MRRMVSIVIALFAAVSVVSLSTLSAQAQSAEQYEASDNTEVQQEATENTNSPETPPTVEGSTSRGSIADADSPEVIAARKDLAEEENLPDYSQVVDNTTKGAFSAKGWKVQRGALSHGGSFATARGAKSPARFAVKIPTSNDYSVYVWWPKSASSGTARFGVQTASGTKWSKVDQEGHSSGMWIRLGSFDMAKGQRSVQVAARSAGGGGQVFADAVAVIRGAGAPPEDQSTAATGERSTATYSKSAGSFTGRDIVRQARRHENDRYRWGACTASLKSCTCLTKVAVAPFGHTLSMTENAQWRYSRSKFVPKSRLRPGDEVFFKEGGSSYITHVGIYSGNGNIWHASAYTGDVTETKMKYISGYFGAKRFKRG